MSEPEMVCSGKKDEENVLPSAFLLLSFSPASFSR